MDFGVETAKCCKSMDFSMKSADFYQNPQIRIHRFPAKLKKKSSFLSQPPRGQHQGNTYVLKIHGFNWNPRISLCNEKPIAYKGNPYIFYLVGLYYPPHFDFRYPKKKKKLSENQT